MLFSLLRGQVAEKFELSQYSFYIRAIYSVTPFNAVKLIKKYELSLAQYGPLVSLEHKQAQLRSYVT